MITVKRVLYTTPSRLVSRALLVYIYDDRLALFYGHELTLILPRLYAQGTNRASCINYR